MVPLKIGRLDMGKQTFDRPNEKASPHVVTALIAKRAELAGRIENAQGELKQLVVDLDNVEATLRIFAPDIDVEQIAPRPVPTAHHAFHGEVSRIVLEALKKAGRPLSTTELTERVMKERGLNLNDSKLKRTISRRVGACLAHWRRERGVLESIRATGQVLYWRIKKTNVEAGGEGSKKRG